MITSTKNSQHDTPAFLQHVEPATSTHASWHEARLADHFVQFYHNEAILLESVTSFIGSGLRAVEGGIVIATAEQHRQIEARLVAQGIDVDAARARHQYVPLDADETMAQVSVDGEPDEKLFRQVIGGAVTRMLSAGFRARIFEGIVTLLWANANRSAALRFERFWSSLGHTQRFALFCAYSLTPFAGHSDPSGYRQVCTLRRREIPAGSSGASVSPFALPAN